MKDRAALEQVMRIDGRNCFAELMMSAIGLDKVTLRFKSYDPSKPAGQRSTGDVSIYMGMYEALRLSRDILSGRVARMGKREREKAAKANSKYPGDVWLSQGGTPSKYSATGRPVARTFSIAPGSNQPWVLCAKQGDAHETKEGLIVMDGNPKVAVRVPCSDERLKELALAIETVVRVWEQLRFGPVCLEAMEMARARREKAISAAKAASSGGQT